MRTIKKNSKRWLAMVLSLVMCLGLLQVPAMAAEGNSTLNVSAFANADNIGQGTTCYGSVTLVNDPIIDSGTPKVWTTGMWGGSQPVTGYNWIHILNPYPDVVDVSCTEDGGKLSITFTPGTVRGEVTVSVGVSANYIHDQLGPMVVEFNFDYTVTNMNGELIAPETPTASTITNAAKVRVECVDNSRHYATYTLKTNPGGWTASAPEPTDSSDEPFTSAGIEWRSVLTLNDEYWVEKYNSSTSIQHVLDSQVTGTVTIKAYWYNGQWTFNTQDATRTIYVEEVSVPSYTYSLTYNGNGGTVNGQASYTATSGSTTATSYSFSELTAVRDGYQFKGWASTQANANAGTVDITWPVTLTSANASKTVYAVWEEVPTGPVSTDVITVNKVFEGLTVDDIPEDFSIVYTAVNKKDPQYSVTKTLTLENFEDFDEDTMTLTWKAPHYYKNGGSDVTIKENGDVTGYTYQTVASKGTVDNNTHTVTVTYSSLTSTATLTLTNTYTPSTVTPENPKLTGIEKERLTVVPDGLGLTGINTADPVNLKVGESATLLYAITVTGDEGANYTITDPTATPVDEDVMSGTIGSTGEATVYVTQTITIDSIVEGYVANTAYVTAGADTDPIPGTNPGEATPSEPAAVATTGVLVSRTVYVKQEDGTVDFTTEITNKVGATLSAVRLAVSMQQIMMVRNGNEPIYTIKLVSKDGNESVPSVSSATSNGRETVWIIDGPIDPDAKVVVTYSGEIDPDVTEDDEWTYSVSAAYMTGQSAAYIGLDAADTMDGWVFSDAIYYDCDEVVGQ